jgi:membrane protease YdiL (CAAX protease family)
VPELSELPKIVEAYLILAAGTGVPIVCLWLLYIRGHPLWPRQRRHVAPWSGFEIALVIFFVFFFWPAVVNQLLSGTGFLNWLYGPQFGTASRGTDQFALDTIRLMPWTSLLAAPWQIATIILVPYLVSGTRPYQLGLNTYDWARNLILGWLGWVILSPAVFGLHLASEWASQLLWHVSPEEHPLVHMFRTGSLRVERLAILVSAVILAPLLEELFFRGLLQRWFARHVCGGDVAMLAALAITVLFRWDKWEEAWHHLGPRGLVHELPPIAFVLVMMPGAHLLSRMLRAKSARPSEIRAIYGTALLFAMFHARVWPTPIPLFVLALGLGYLAHRTQNLLAPIVMHALFNAITGLALFLS